MPIQFRHIPDKIVVSQSFLLYDELSIVHDKQAGDNQRHVNRELWGRFMLKFCSILEEESRIQPVMIHTFSSTRGQPSEISRTLFTFLIETRYTHTTIYYTIKSISESNNSILSESNNSILTIYSILTRATEGTLKKRLARDRMKSPLSAVERSDPKKSMERRSA